MMFHLPTNPSAEPIRSFDIHFSFSMRDEKDLESLNQLLTGLPLTHLKLYVAQGYIARVQHCEPDGSGGTVVTGIEYHAGMDEGVLICHEDRRHPRHIYRIDEQVLQSPVEDEKAFIDDWEKLHPGRKVAGLNWRPSHCEQCGCFIIHHEKPSSFLC